MSSAATVLTPATTSTTWSLDQAHSTVEFTVRHMVVATFSGKFTSFDAEIQFDEVRPETASVSATVDVASIETGNEQRNGHLRSDDFFNAEQYPQMTFTSTRIVRDGGEFKIHGDLTIRDVTKPVVFEAEYGGQVIDPWGNARLGIVAETTINRREFGLNWNGLIESGGAIVADKVKIKLHVEATRPA
jgi:polyisoprenoid-binding protein YceI